MIDDYTGTHLYNTITMLGRKLYDVAYPRRLTLTADANHLV